MMKQLGQIEKYMKETSDEVQKLTATGSAGAGLVEVTVNGKFQVVSLNINPVILDKQQKDMAEVLIQSAFNEAITKLTAIIEERARRMLPLDKMEFSK